RNGVTLVWQNWRNHESTGAPTAQPRDSVAACPPDLTVYPIVVGPADIWLPAHEPLVPDARGYRRKFPPIGGAGHSHFGGDGRARAAGRRRAAYRRVPIQSVLAPF